MNHGGSLLLRSAKGEEAIVHGCLSSPFNPVNHGSRQLLVWYQIESILKLWVKSLHRISDTLDLLEGQPLDFLIDLLLLLLCRAAEHLCLSRKSRAQRVEPCGVNLVALLLGHFVHTINFCQCTEARLSSIISFCLIPYINVVVRFLIGFVVCRFFFGEPAALLLLLLLLFGKFFFFFSCLFLTRARRNFLQAWQASLSAKEPIEALQEDRISVFFSAAEA
mmetsp:Transcript_5773/g.11027  ORF Transcript_5773/g.11027 Transcript_5773/m.11027 type:complete len:221 (-) Transcript_5773:1441-2103(-)